MSNKVTITVDLDAVKNLVENTALYNSGLQIEHGICSDDLLYPEDLDIAIRKMLVRGKATEELRNLLLEIVKIHNEAHEKFKEV